MLERYWREGLMVVIGFGASLAFFLLNSTGTNYHWVPRAIGIVLAVTASAWIMSKDATRNELVRRCVLGLLGAALPVLLLIVWWVAVCEPAHCAD
jgi:hypothetical protein